MHYLQTQISNIESLAQNFDYVVPQLALVFCIWTKKNANSSHSHTNANTNSYIFEQINPLIFVTTHAEEHRYNENEEKPENTPINAELFAEQKLELRAKQKNICNQLKQNTQRRSQKFSTMSHKHKIR